MFEHRIQDNQQFPHVGRQGDLLGLASRTEALIERTDRGIEACDDSHGHVQRRPDLGATVPDRALPAPRPAVTIQGLLGRSHQLAGHTTPSRHPHLW